MGHLTVKCAQRIPTDHIDLSQSILFGDRLSDLIAGKRAGLKEVFHLLSGHGKEDRLKVIQNIKKT